MVTMTDRNHGVVLGNAKKETKGTGNREWISAMRSAKMREKLDFHLLLADGAEPDLIHEDDTHTDLETQKRRLENEVHEAEEQQLRRRLRAARQMENSRFQLSHQVNLRDAHRLDAEAFTEDSTRPIVDAWRRKTVEPIGGDEEFSARELALWRPISEGMVMPEQQYSHALLYRRAELTDQKEVPSVPVSPSNRSRFDSNASAAKDSQPSCTDGEPFGPWRVWNSALKVSADKTASKLFQSAPRANIQQLCKERRAGKTPKSVKRPASASGPGGRGTAATIRTASAGRSGRRQAQTLTFFNKDSI